MVKRITGRTWNRSAKVWEVPIENFQDAQKVFPRAMIHPDVTKLVQIAQQRRTEVLRVKELTDADRRVPGLKGTLYPYQAVGKKFLSLLRDTEGAILGFDMGLGKTICAIASFLELYNAGKAKRCLVVCPASLKYATWEKEIKKWTDLSYIVIDGEPYNPEDREVLIDYEEEDWARNPDGTRQFIYEPVYGRIEVAELTRPIPFVQLTGDFERELLPFLEGYSSKDQPGDVIVEDENVVAVKMRRYKRDKRTYLKEKTGTVVEKIIRMSGRELREVQYQQDDRVFIIMNYELFLHDMDIIPKIDNNWVVILDECHRIKSTRAKTSKNLLEHCQNAGRKFLLSGTPLENNIAELWNLVDFARSGLLGTFYKYKQRYIMLDLYDNMIAPKPQMLPELRDKIAPIILRKRKDEVLPDLPPLVEIPYWVDMLPEQRALYDEVREGILANLEGDDFTYLSVLAQLTRFQQIVDSPALLAEVLPDRDLPEDSAKMQELWNILEDINIQDNKVIIFSQYRRMTDILYSHLKERYGTEAIRYISGQVKNVQLRGIYQDEFQTKEEVRIMLLTTAGNYGLDLYKASYVICYDQLFNPQKMNQVISRAHRNGAEQKITAVHLLTRDSYEERKVRLLEEKREVFGAIIDDDDLMMQKLLTKYDLKGLI